MAIRVLHMNPPTGLYRRDDRCQSRVADQTVRVVFAPIDMALMAAVARRAGADALIRDYPGEGKGATDLQADAARFKPDLVLFNATIHTAAADLDAMSLVRREAPNARIVARGESVAASADAFLSRHGGPDAIFVGEPEGTWEEMVAGRPWKDLPGLVWKDAVGEIHRGNPRGLIADLDSLPLPARDLLDNNLYRSPENGRPLTVIHAQRGCPSRCIFCPAGSMYGYKVRERSPATIVSELRECVERFGIRDFLFHGDTFTLHRDWVVELCREIVDAGLDIRWGCNSRIDTMDDQRAQSLRKAGCWVVAFGFEHGSQMILDKMRKGQRAERAFEAVAACRRNGLRVHGFFVAGLPWETRETLAELLTYARRLDTDFFDFNLAYPLPGTEYHEIAVREGLIEAEGAEGSYADAACRSFTLSPADLTAWRKRALISMYLRPRYVARTLCHAASGGNLGRYVSAAMARLASLAQTG